MSIKLQIKVCIFCDESILNLIYVTENTEISNSLIFWYRKIIFQSRLETLPAELLEELPVFFYSVPKMR